MRILAIGAHVDDIPLCAAGTFAQLTADGHEVQALYTCNFVGSELSIDGWNEALEIIGVQGRKVMDYGYGQVRDNPELRSEINKALDDFRPHTIFVQWPQAWQNDEEVTGRVTREIIVERERLHFTYYFGLQLTTIGFAPDVYVDITKKWDKKLKCLSKLAGVKKAGDPEHLLRLAGAESLRYGVECSVQYAEAFKLAVKRAHPTLPEFKRPWFMPPESD